MVFFHAIKSSHGEFSMRGFCYFDYLTVTVKYFFTTVPDLSLTFTHTS